MQGRGNNFKRQPHAGKSGRSMPHPSPREKSDQGIKLNQSRRLLKKHIDSVESADIDSVIRLRSHPSPREKSDQGIKLNQSRRLLKKHIDSVESADIDSVISLRSHSRRFKMGEALPWIKSSSEKLKSAICTRNARCDKLMFPYFKEATNKEATNKEATNKEATNKEATNKEATNLEARKYLKTLKDLLSKDNEEEILSFYTVNEFFHINGLMFECNAFNLLKIESTLKKYWQILEEVSHNYGKRKDQRLLKEKGIFCEDLKQSYLKSVIKELELELVDELDPNDQDQDHDTEIFPDLDLSFLDYIKRHFRGDILILMQDEAKDLENNYYSKFYAQSMYYLDEYFVIVKESTSINDDDDNKRKKDIAESEWVEFKENMLKEALKIFCNGYRYDKYLLETSQYIEYFMGNDDPDRGIELKELTEKKLMTEVWPQLKQILQGSSSKIQGTTSEVFIQDKEEPSLQLPTSTSLSDPQCSSVEKQEQQDSVEHTQCIAQVPDEDLTDGFYIVTLDMVGTLLGTKVTEVEEHSR